MADLRSLAISLQLDSGNFDKSLSEVNKQISSLNRQVRSSDKLLKAVPDDLSAIAKQSDNLTLKSKLLEEKQKALGEQFEKVTESMSKNDDGTINLAESTVTARNSFNRLTAELSIVEDEMKTVNKQQENLKNSSNDLKNALNKQNDALSDNQDALKDGTDTLGDNIKKQKDLKDSVNDTEKALKDQADAYELISRKADLVSNKVGAIQGVTGSVGNALTIGAGAVLGVGTVAASIGMDRQSANSDILRVSAVENEEEFLKNLSEIFSDSLYENYSDFSAVWEGIGAAGISGWENQKAAYDAITELTVASGSDASEVTQLLTSSVGLLHLSAEEVGKYASALASAGNAGSSTDEQVQTMAMKIAGLTTMDVSASNIATLSSFYSSAGIQPDVASSSSVSVFNSLVNANNEVEEGALSYSEVLGITNEEYDNLRKQDPTELFQLFIEGMNRLKDQGYAINDVMAQLGIDSSQDQNLLRLSTAQSNIFQSIQTQVADAYATGDAATIEYDKKAETADAKLQQRMNDLKMQVADIGESLLPVLLDFLEAAEPLFESIENFSEWFVELDEDTKKFLTTLTLLTLGTGLALKGFTLLMSPVKGVADLISTFANLGKAKTEIALLAGGLEKTAIATGAFNTASGTAVGSVTTLTGAFGGLAGSLAAIAGIATVAVVAGLIIKKAYDINEYNKSTLNGWLDDLDETLREEVEERRALTLELNTEIKTNYGSEVTEEMVEDTNKKIEDISEKINEDYESAIALNNTTAANIELTDDSRQAIEARKTELDSAKTETENYHNEITAIQQKALDEKRALTSDELSLIQEYEDKVSESWARIKGISETEQTAIYKSLTDSTNAGLDKAQMKGLAKKMPETISKVKNSYADQKASLDNMRREELIGEEDYYSSLSEMEDKRQKDMMGLAIEYYDALGGGSIAKDLALGNTEVGEEDFENGYAYSRFQKDFSINSNLKDTPEGKESADLWNSFFNEETGYDFTSDPLKQLRDYIAGENGIAGIQSIIANNDISNGIDDMLLESVVMAGRWNDLSLEDKKVLIDDDAIYEFQNNMQELGIWDLLTNREQNSVVNAKDKDSALSSLMTSDTWESVDNKQRNSIMGTDISDEMFKRIDAINGWNNEKIREKVLTVDYSSYDSANNELKGFLSNYGNMVIPKKVIDVDSDPAYQGINTALSYLNEFRNQDRVITFIAKLQDNITFDFQTISENAKTTANDLSTFFTGVWSNISDFFSNLGSKASETYKTALDNYTTSLKEQSNNPISIYPYASGTSYHPGGLAVLGDGGKSEPYLTPSGAFGISPAIDTLVNLPKGSQVWPSMERFIADLPHFDNGTSQSFLTDASVTNSGSNSINLTVHMAANSTFTKENQRELVKVITKELNRNNNQLTKARGGHN